MEPRKLLLTTACLLGAMTLQISPAKAEGYPFDMAARNKDALFVHSVNCYAYAVGAYQPGAHLPVPGQFAGLPHWNPGEIDRADFLRRVAADGLIQTETPVDKPGHSLVALFLQEEDGKVESQHWVVQNSNGIVSHKTGDSHATPVYAEDGSIVQSIADLKDASLVEGFTFAGFFQVPNYPRTVTQFPFEQRLQEPPNRGFLLNIADAILQYRPPYTPRLNRQLPHWGR
jgi:hypothetical protein